MKHLHFTGSVKLHKVLQDPDLRREECLRASMHTHLLYSLGFALPLPQGHFEKTESHAFLPKQVPSISFAKATFLASEMARTRLGGTSQCWGGSTDLPLEALPIC